MLLPGISQIANTYTPNGDESFAIDRAVTKADEQSLNLLLSFISPDVPDSLIKREAALGLRSFADLASTRISIQRKIEKSILTSLPSTNDRETRIAFVENLGYFGTSSSLPILSDLALDDKDSHVRWASVVAIGRLPDKVNIEILIKAFEVEGITTGENWPSAAALLSLSRRVELADQPVVEPFLCSVLEIGNGVVSRYACLALSRFSTVGKCVFDELLNLLGNEQAEASARGYAALAVSGLLRSVEPSELGKIENLVESLCKQDVLDVEEPEDVWATEFLAELASLLELEDVSVQLNMMLSNVYTDWRADYYDALASYAQAEIAVRSEKYADATDNFMAAIKRLESISTSMESSKGLSLATANFRLDITRARLRLHQLLLSWVDCAGAPPNYLVSEAAEIAAIYRTYSSREAELTGSKQLSQRELTYVVSTRRLVEFLKLLIELDVMSRRKIDEVDADIETIVNQALGYVDDLGDRFHASLARGLEHLVEILRSQLINLRKAFDANVAIGSKLSVVRSVVGEMRTAFSHANWPMPARACPVGGLGRGEIKIITEGLNGNGSRDDPLRFPDDSCSVLNVAIRIIEMAPGGATRVAIKLRIG
ncbi:MAG: HEAT repeat domain-containing protein [Candidatus Thiodiazotropha endolucinida]|nr:HEAT repeat domain-containing protein [Candidatus Thiodiazotropha taylori]MCW4223704.1 HEAT repeat domain-containing protein [Candidatus Thiodiazotropha endolucinida]